MSILFIVGIFIIAVFAAVSFVSIKKHEKHDRVLFSFSRLQSAVMKEILARHDAETLTRKQYEAAKFLLDMLDDIARHYDTHKTTMFNLRKMRRMVEQDLERFNEMQRQVDARLAEIPADAKIRGLYVDFARAAADAFLAYTPFIRTEIILRLLWSDIAEQVANIRREQKILGKKIA